MEENSSRVDPAEDEVIEGEATPVGANEAQELQREGSTLEEELKTAYAKAEEYLDGWQRSRAEFSNYKKRVEREQSLVYQNAAAGIIKRYIEIADDLERALKNRPAEGDGAAWAHGIDLIYRKFLSYLEAEGVRQMEVKGQPFDPNMHEAITQEESDMYESGQVIEVVQQGYMIGDRVLRPAMVRVAR